MFDDRIISKKLLRVFKPRLRRHMQRAAPHAMISRNRMQNLHRLFHRIDRDGVKGDVVETGVARGGSAILLAGFIDDSPVDRELWLYDAFELLDQAGATCAEVEHLLFDTCGLNRDTVHLFGGLFEDTVPRRPERPIALLHVDCPGYGPNRYCLDTLGPLVQPGGYVVIDNYVSSDGGRDAVDDYVRDEHGSARLERFGHTQAYFRVG